MERILKLEKLNVLKIAFFLINELCTCESSLIRSRGAYVDGVCLVGYVERVKGTYMVFSYPTVYRCLWYKGVLYEPFMHAQVSHDI